MTSLWLSRQGDAEEFRAPRCDGMSLPDAARKIADEYGAALGLLAREVASAHGIPGGLRPLAWFRALDGVVQCGSCSTDVVVTPGLLRCPDCGCVAAAMPDWWSR